MLVWHVAILADHSNWHRKLFQNIILDRVLIIAICLTFIPTIFPSVLPSCHGVDATYVNPTHKSCFGSYFLFEKLGQFVLCDCRVIAWYGTYISFLCMIGFSIFKAHGAIILHHLLCDSWRHRKIKLSPMWNALTLIPGLLVVYISSYFFLLIALNSSGENLLQISSLQKDSNFYCDRQIGDFAHTFLPIRLVAVAFSLFFFGVSVVALLNIRALWHEE